METSKVLKKMVQGGKENEKMASDSGTGRGVECLYG